MTYYIITAIIAFLIGHYVGYNLRSKQLAEPIAILTRLAEKYDWGRAKICEDDN